MLLKAAPHCIEGKDASGRTQLMVACSAPAELAFREDATQVGGGRQGIRDAYVNTPLNIALAAMKDSGRVGIH